MTAGFSLDLRYRLPRLELEVELRSEGGILALIGPSGAGKTTVLNLIAGALSPDSGRISIGERTVVDTEAGVSLPLEARRVGMVFQDGALFPHLTVLQNVAFGARDGGSSISRRHRRAAAESALERLAAKDLAGARPSDLSAGERQRVALARALVTDPEILLLDEPLSSVDTTAKAELVNVLSDKARLGDVSTILVSHDLQDALSLADEVAVMDSGRIVQTGTARELVENPNSPFVARMAGINHFEGVASRGEGVTLIAADGWSTDIKTADEASGRVSVVVYPWEVALSKVAPGGSALNCLEGTVGRISIIGNRARVTVRSEPSVVAEVMVESIDRLGLSQGSTVVASWKATATRVAD